MEAHNKPISSLLSDIERGVILLPRFQRKTVWNPEITETFLEAVLEKHPLGALLLLEVDSHNPPFTTRPLVGVNHTEGCRLNLLDGQQRITALLTALNDSDEKLKYYVAFSENQSGQFEVEHVERHSKRRSWHDDPIKVFKKNLIPFSFLKPGDDSLMRANQWKAQISEEMKWDPEQSQKLDSFIAKVRETIIQTSIPCLLLQQGMDTDIVIEIFININRSSVKLNSFEIANAQCEQEVSESLQEYIDELEEEIPHLNKLIAKKKRANKGLGDMVLRMACMDQGKAPQESSYKDLSFEKLQERLNDYTNGYKWTERFLLDEGFWDESLMPSKAPIRILPLLYLLIRSFTRHDLDRARRLIRAYLWRSFATEWYTKKTNGRTDKDFKWLIEALSSRNFEIPKSLNDDVIFNSKLNPLPSADKVKDAGWPKSQSAFLRSILAVSVKDGALGLETGEEISSSSSIDAERHYHHVYPKAQLKEHEIDFDLAMNCMLIEGKANRSWNKLWPGDWLDKKIKKLGGESVGRRHIINRLKTHTVPVDLLLEARQEKEVPRLLYSYEEYCDVRANMIYSKLNSLCSNGVWS